MAPTPSPVRHQVFISYSHRDREWLERLRTTLKPLVRKGTITVWDDTQIEPGQPWREAITQALARAWVAVLLVSPDFLASDFIHEHELPPLLEAAEKEGLTILWVPISASLYTATEIVRYQAAWSPDHPLDCLSVPEQNQALVTIGYAIQDAVAAVQPEPEKADAARLRFVRGAPVSLTRVFARRTIVLGRPKLSADLWLTLFPMDDPANRRLMDSVSESHAVLRMANGAAIRDDESRAGTEVDGEPLGRQERALTEGATIGFAHGALQLRARCEPGHWVRLERLANGAEVESYLLLEERAVLGTRPTAALPVREDWDSGRDLAELRHAEGGFVMAPGEAPLVINGGQAQRGMPVGLRDGDRVEVGPLVFEFGTGAYPS